MALRKRGEGPDRAKVPVLLAIGEFFLCLTIIRYMLNFLINLQIRVDDAGTMSLRIFSLLFSLAMILMTVSSVIGIASARPKSWRRVVRTSILLLLVNLGYEALESLGVELAGAVFDNYFLAVTTAITIGVMMLPSVRRFYLPPMTDDPPLSKWAGYVFATRLFPEATYRYAKDRGRRPLDYDIMSLSTALLLRLLSILRTSVAPSAFAMASSSPSSYAHWQET